MKSTELRIGNWINRGWYGNDETEDAQSTTRDLMEFDDWIIKPIPLTEEWLLKFGFEYSSSYETYCKGDYCIHIKDGEFHFMNDSCSNAGCYYLTTIKYVHQLQNLYHALGEELTIK